MNCRITIVAGLVLQTSFEASLWVFPVKLKHAFYIILECLFFILLIGNVARLSQGHHTPVSSTDTEDIWRYTSTLI
jgi:hypothetical protein